MYNMEKVSIGIPVYINNGKQRLFDMTRVCIDGIMGSIGVETEVIVVDDGSTYPKLELFLKKLYPHIIYVKNEENLGFAKTVNKGIKLAKFDKILLLNNDTVVTSKHWLIKLVETLNGGADMTAPAGGRLDAKFNYIVGEAMSPAQKFTYLVGWCLLVKKSVFEKIGYMPEDFRKGYFEDVLFSLRAKRAGLKLQITDLRYTDPYYNKLTLGIEHLYHQTFKAEGYNLAKEYQEKRAIFLDIVKKEGITNS